MKKSTGKTLFIVLLAIAFMAALAVFASAEGRRTSDSNTEYYTVKAYNLVPNATDGFDTVEIYHKSLPAGTILFDADLADEDGNNPTLELNETFRYTFRGWSTSLEDLTALQNAAIAADPNMPKDPERNGAMPLDASTDSEVTLPQTVLPLTVEDNITLYAVYRPHFINYSISLYQADGITRYYNYGYLHYGNVIAPAAPAKPEDAYGVWGKFTGWQKMDPAFDEDTTPTFNLLITGDARYKPTYALTEHKKYTVTWAFENQILGETIVEAGEDAVYDSETPGPLTFGYEPVKAGHFVFYGYLNCVLDNALVNVFTIISEHCPIRETTSLTCTTGEGWHSVCKECGYIIEQSYTQDPLGHDYEVTASIEATCSTTGFGTYLCRRCGYTFTGEIPVDPTNHIHPRPAVHENEIPSTCITVGSYDEVIYCGDCDKEISRTRKALSRGDHTFGRPEIVDSTIVDCEIGGSATVVFYCTECGDEIGRQTVDISGAPHDVETWESHDIYADTAYREGVCVVCGKTVREPIEPLPKVLDDPQPEKSATNLNFFQRVIQWFRNLFAKLFGRK